MSSGVEVYRKKPLDVPAIQWTGREDSLLAIISFAGGHVREFLTGENILEVYDKLHDSWIKVFVGQWILRGTEGEFYPHDDEPFRRNYEKVKAE